MSIKNVIFDFGQVLVHFEPEYMVRQYVSNEADVPLLTEVIFDRLYWNKLDEGTITNEEVLSECHKRLPKRLWELCDEIYYGWIYNIPEIEGMRDLIKYIKEEFGSGKPGLPCAWSYLPRERMNCQENCNTP